MIVGTLIFIGLMSLIVLTMAAIIDTAIEHFTTASSVEIVDPKLSEELERIAAERGTSKRHKRFVYDRASKKAVLIESNRIADELKDADRVTVDLH